MVVRDRKMILVMEFPKPNCYNWRRCVKIKLLGVILGGIFPLKPLTL